MQDPLLLWGLTDRRRYFPPAVAVSAYLALSAAGQLVAGFRAGADSLLDEHTRQALYLLRCRPARVHASLLRSPSLQAAGMSSSRVLRLVLPTAVW